MKISTKLLVSFLLISIVPLSVLGILYYFSAKEALTTQIFNQLQSVASVQKNRVKSIIDHNIERLTVVSSRTQLLVSMDKYIREGKDDDKERLRIILRDARSSIPDFEDIHLLSLSGEVVASTDTSMIGTKHSDKDYFEVGQAGITRSHILFLDGNRHLKAHISGPLYLENKIIGVVVIKTNAEHIISLVQDYTGLGRSGETVLARKDDNETALFITPLRFDPLAALSHSVSMNELDAPIVQALLQNEQLFVNATDYRGEKVLAVTRYIKETDWGLVVKIDKAEAFASMAKLRNFLLIIILLSAGTVIIVSILVSRAITSPVVRLTKTAKNISTGDLSLKAEITTKDETGALAEAFNTMTANLINARVKLEEKIKEHVNTEKSLRNAYQLLELFFKYTLDNIVLLDKNFNFIRVNEAYARACQRDVSEFPGHNHFEFYPSDAKAIFENVVKTKTPYSVRARPFVFPDHPEWGVTYWDWTLVPIIENENVALLIFTLKDVTEQKKAEEELFKYRDHLEELVDARTHELEGANIRLKELDQLKSMFIASMSHELRTPLNSIIGFTRIILDGLVGELNPRQEDQLNRVHKAAHHLLAMINDIIDISKIEAGRVEAFPEKFTLEEIIDEASGNIQIQLREKGLNYEVNVPSDLQMNTDRKRLLQCILNLLSNAVNFTETGTVGITARGIDKELEIAVSDTGIGIPGKDMPKLFKPFERIETRLRFKPGGTGLGLYLTKKIVTELLGGTIEVESEEGKGSTFLLKVPKDIEQAGRLKTTEDERSKE